MKQTLAALVVTLAVTATASARPLALEPLPGGWTAQPVQVAPERQLYVVGGLEDAWSSWDRLEALVQEAMEDVSIDGNTELEVGGMAIELETGTGRLDGVDYAITLAVVTAARRSFGWIAIARAS